MLQRTQTTITLSLTIIIIMTIIIMLMMRNILNGLSHNCLVHFANIANHTSLFATEPTVSNEITGKLPKSGFFSCVTRSFVGHRPTRLRPKAEDTSGEAARKSFSRGTLFKT